MLLKDVRLVSDDTLVTDHVWFTCGRWSEDISEGDVVEFDARVMSYKKGYRGYREDMWDAPPPSIDYRLERPTKVEILTK